MGSSVHKAHGRLVDVVVPYLGKQSKGFFTRSMSLIGSERENTRSPPRKGQHNLVRPHCMACINEHAELSTTDLLHECRESQR